MTKLRLCDKCKKEIEGKFIKCVESSWDTKKLILTHVGDLCPYCWENFTKHKCDNCEENFVEHKGEWCESCNLPERSCNK